MILKWCCVFARPSQWDAEKKSAETYSFLKLTRETESRQETEKKNIDINYEVFQLGIAHIYVTLV